MAATITEVFGTVKEIGDIIKAFDFSKINIKDEKAEEDLHCDLAPAYGTLNVESMKNLDEHLKIIIATTMKTLAAQKDKSWDAVLSTMMQNPVLKPIESSDVARSDKLIKKGSHNFKADGSPDDAIVKEVEVWFKKLLQDDDVEQSTRIKIHVLGKIVAQTGAIITGLIDFFHKHEYHEQKVLDIGVLRFPDIDQPFFKLYRIQLDVWSNCTRTVFHQYDDNGITGQFNMRKFATRDNVIDQMTKEAKKHAADRMWA
ncbi:hypothetical protein QBC38DRAFT_548148 [Podospora fimiseda]|uniref:Uncharacterized protein n=1 Tax=Podospora fimiseda TaxID=252190 RepID=A0AAN7GW03_9PEZI|nr:hypothetical protein QBC38DRAFT_548148 [Podospora fimiseda]